MRVIAGLGTLALLGGATTVPSAADAAASATSAVFSGEAGTYTAADGTVYAKQGAALTLTVTADAQMDCVQVTSGSQSVYQTSTGTSTGQRTFTFTSGLPIFTAGSGNGLATATVIAFSNVNANGGCKGNQSSTSASYTLDNTAPTATGTLQPAPNAAGWNNTDVTVKWTGNDAGGSGIASVSPAADSVTGDGTVTRTAKVTDNVGNTATASVLVNLDKTAPSIVGSRTPAANANGWNNTDVTVSFRGTDSTSGIKSTSSSTTVTQNGANQSVTGTATDNADNASSTTVGGINIDKVAPTLSGMPTTAPNTNGWYDGDVTVAWAATDTLSGTSTPANSTITGEGSGLTASATAVDKAGNSTTAQSAPVNIDRTAPNTSVTAPSIWSNSDVTLTLAASDALSGVDKTFYVLDNGQQASGTSVSVTTEGSHTLEFWSTDRAGNVETAHTVSFGIDKSKPTITHTQSPAANADGWNSSDVTVSFTCDDAVSGMASCTAPQTVTTEGQGQQVTGTATDNAGNTATDPASVSIDKTPPVIKVDPLPEPNSYGWYGSDVTATFTASDNLSGVKTQDKAHTFGEGKEQTATATATDAAGNSSSVTTPVVNVDTTAPTISGELVEKPTASGWYTGNVTVHWTCDDNLSGVVACPEDSVVDGEGSNLSAIASVTDKAGHTATATVDGINIDRHAPSTTADGVPAGWVKVPVTIGLNGVDSLSDVAATYYEIDGATTPVEGTTVTVGAEGAHTVKYWSVDNAGNVEDPQTFLVKVDLSSPSIRPTQSPEQNANGWNNTDVTVSFNCSDQIDLSGVRACADPETISTEGEAQQVTGTASDNAGNTATATTTVNIDKTAPTISGAPDRAPNANDWYNDDVTVTFTAADKLSGIDTFTGPQRLGEGADQHVTGTATDNAGNRTGATVSGINVDKTDPTLSAAPTTTPNANGWYNTDVTEVWAADDALSGLIGVKPGDDRLTNEGKGQTVSATVSDKAGNTVSATSAPVNIDKTAPTTDASAPSGWVNGDVKVTLSPHDGLSGVASTHYAVDRGDEQTGTTVTLSTQGSHTIAYYSVDQAGNVEQTNSVTVQIDKTAPTITHTLVPEANTNGWNNSDVTVTFACADQDQLSGVASCTKAQTVTTEGAGQTVDGTAMDNAGNSASDTAMVNVDKTKPTIDGSRTPAANENGWNNTPVTVHFEAKDALSGIGSVTKDQTLGEGTDQTLEGTAVDAAGNEASTTLDGINVDETAPTLTGTPTTDPDANNWYRGDVTIGWTASDDRSGVVSTPVDSTITGEGKGLTATATVRDKADNSTTVASAAVNIDRTAPVTGANAPMGWNKLAVTVSLDATDGLSGVAGTYYSVDGSDPVEGTTLTIGTDGAHTVSYWSVDKAGNTENAKTVTVQVDTVAPVVTIGGVKDGGFYTIGAAPTPTVSATDATSGLAAPATGTLTGGTSNGVGTFTYTATATDKAGNTTVTSVAYSVVYGYGSTLFLQPVNDTAHQIGLATSVFKAGQTIPMKFQLRNAAGTVIQAASAPKWLTPVKGSGATAAVNESTLSGAGDTGSTYRWDGTQYIYNWNTSSSQAGSYWRVGVALDDGQTYSVTIALR